MKNLRKHFNSENAHKNELKLIPVRFWQAEDLAEVPSIFLSELVAA